MKTGKTRHAVHNPFGFTLLEVMIALLIISIGIVSVIQLTRINLKGLGSADDHIESGIRSEAKMQDILGMPSMKDKTWRDTDDAGYTYDVAVSEMMTERTDSLPVKLEEITLTTRWMKGNNPKQLVLKTVKVSFRSDS